MKKMLKKFGKFFIALSQKDEKDMRQSILLIDGSFILPNNFALIIKNVKEKFKNAKLVVLTFYDKREFIKDNFPDAEIVIPSDRIMPNRHQLAIQLFLLLRRNFNFIILSSLDISIVSISLIFAKCPIFLHNRWLEWYRIRQRTLLDVLKGIRSTDRNRRRKNKDIRDILKTLGRISVILTDVNEENTKYSVLIVDNGYTEISHVLTAVRQAAKNFVNPDITILTFPSRKHYFANMFPQMKIAIVEETHNRYGLAIQMYRIRKPRFTRIVLTTLDISPILVSLLFMKTEILLYNKWHQWWSLDLKNIWGYLKEILIFLAMIPVSIYLFFTTLFILLRTRFRLGLTNIKSIVAKKK